MTDNERDTILKALQSAEDHLPGVLRTRDIGVCVDCGGMTTSGMIKTCHKCHRNRLEAAYLVFYPK